MQWWMRDVTTTQEISVGSVVRKWMRCVWNIRLRSDRFLVRQGTHTHLILQSIYSHLMFCSVEEISLGLQWFDAVGVARAVAGMVDGVGVARMVDSVDLANIG